MKALQLEKPLSWVRLDIPEPLPPGPGEALVRVHRVGICGTDLSGYLGKMPFFSYPRIPGHELGVEILAVGPEGMDFLPGGHLLSHAAGGGKPWRGGFLRAALRGRPPGTAADSGDPQPRRAHGRGRPGAQRPRDRR